MAGIRICPVCEAEVEFEVVRVTEEFDVRGDLIPVEVEYLRCPACGEEIDSAGGPDPFDAAYAVYRRNHGMLQPEEIAGIRQRLGLSVEALADLLRTTPGVVAGYEAGALQSDEHDAALKALLQDSPAASSDDPNQGK